MKILFITHNSAFAGAPMVLLYFLQWIEAYHPEVEIHLLDMAPGAMAEDFKICCHTYQVLPNKAIKRNTATKFLEKTYFFKEKGKREELIIQLAGSRFDVVYSNTIKAIPIGALIKELSPRTKFIAHIHELPTVIKLQLPEINHYLPQIDFTIVVSNMVKDKLYDMFHSPEIKTCTVYEFSKPESFFEPKQSNGKFCVGASGYVDWRKGYDAFIQVARYIEKYHPKTEITFTWVGTIPYDTEIIIHADLEKLGLLKKVHFIGLQENPWPFYSNFDVFMLPSREDPFPLVCIEMAMLKKPILCFENAVGTSEILKSGGGKIIPYLDIEAMAEAILEYYNNRQLLENDGEIAAQLFGEFTPENQCPKLFSAIEETLKNTRP